MKFGSMSFLRTDTSACCDKVASPTIICISLSRAELFKNDMSK